MRLDEINPREGFRGSVSFVGQVNGPDGRWTGAVAGWVKVLPADVTGMQPARGDTPWLVAVSGENQTVFVPGCKVFLVTAGEVSGPDVYVVP